MSILKYFQSVPLTEDVLDTSDSVQNPSFSAMKRIKTAVRSSMVTKRLTGLTLLHIHRDIPLEISDVIDEFARRHPRRLKLSNILVD